MNNTQKAQQLNGVAIALAPSLQRYDFSDQERQIKAWADITFAAAKEFTDRTIANYEAGQAKDNAELEAAVKAAKEAQAKAAADQLAKDAENHAAVKQVIEESKANGEAT